LNQTQFLKVVDTLNKYQQTNIDFTTQEGRDFVVFRRQLF